MNISVNQLKIFIHYENLTVTVCFVGALFEILYSSCKVPLYRLIVRAKPSLTFVVFDFAFAKLVNKILSPPPNN